MSIFPKAHITIRLIIAGCLTIAMINTIKAQDTISKNQIPHFVAKTFSDLYPEIKTEQWLKIPSYYIAVFKTENSTASVKITEGGYWVVTQYPIDKKELPKELKQYLKKNYPKFKIFKALLESKNEPSYMVVIHLKSKSKELFKSLFFSTNGLFLKEQDTLYE
jgi:hypothetical protein